MNIPINEAHVLFVKLVDATDNKTAETGLTGITTQYCKADGTAWSSFTPSATQEIGNGVYRFTVPASYIDTEGEIVFRVYKSTVTNDFVTVRYVTDYSADAQQVTLSDATIETIASAVMFTTVSSAETDASGKSWDPPALPSSTWKQTLAGAIWSQTGGWSISGSTLTVSDSSGTTIFTKTIPGTVGADSANLPTGIT
jgi:hypothetical protein